jgi:hypothetical protein
MKIPDIKRLIERAAVVKVNNALNPLLWLTAVVTPVSMVMAVLAASLGSFVFSGFLVLLSSLPVLASIGAYFWFMKNDPNRLHSEEYQLRQQELILLQKGEDAPILIEESESVSKAEGLKRRPKRKVE